MQTLREVGTLKQLCKPSTFGLEVYTAAFEFSQPSPLVCIRLYKHKNSFYFLNRVNEP